jgi:hypothetical protein
VRCSSLVTLGMTHPMLRAARAAGFGLLAAAAGACTLFTVSEHHPVAPRRVLFIGNSLTEENNLPGLVSAMVDATGLPSLTIGLDVVDATNLADHWEGNAPAKIDAGWDIVVLQQGPTSRAADRVELRMVVARFAARIRANGGEPALYMVWPAAEDAVNFESVSTSYRVAAEDVGGYLYPVGEAWLEAWRRNIAMPLYGPDNFHPSTYGTYTAALTIIGVTYGRSVVGMPSRFLLSDGTSFWINPVDARVLQESVDIAVRRHGRRP